MPWKALSGDRPGRVGDANPKRRSISYLPWWRSTVGMGALGATECPCLVPLVLFTVLNPDCPRGLQVRK